MSKAREQMKGLRLRFNCHIYKILVLIFLCGSVSAQVIRVMDGDGTALPGVEVYTQDLTFGELTDDNGEVHISGVDLDVLIHFRFLGFQEYSASVTTIMTQDNMVRLKINDQILEEVVVLGRKTVAQSEIPFQVHTIDIKDIQATNAQTSADALSQHGGLYVQKSQMGGGSPVIRGFEANRVLLVVDDIRLNNAIYRSGHLQNAITVDQAMLDRMEIIFGPNSLMYGSDALGGVVNFKTRNPKLSSSSDQMSSDVNYYIRYATANQEKSGHLDFSLGSDKLGSLTSISYSDYGDLRAGENRDDRFPEFGLRSIIQSTGINGEDIALDNDEPNVQIGTGYNQVDILQKLLFIPNNKHRISANIQYSASSDVPRYDNLSELRDGQLRWAEWYYGPQKRLLTALDYRHLKATTWYDQLIVIGAFQKIDEDRISRRFNNTVRASQEEDVSVYSFTIDASKSINSNNAWAFEYGADIQHNVVNSQASSIDIITGSREFQPLTRYASDINGLTNIGGYLYMKGKAKDESLNFNTGVRYALSTYRLKYSTNDPIDWPSSFYEGINGSNKAVTGSIGGTWKISTPWQIRGMVSTAFRSPNIDDLSKVRVNGSEITFPNLDLNPERSSNIELTLAYTKSKTINASVTGFYTKLSDAIVRRSFSAPNGQNVWVTQGDTLTVVSNVNAQSGTISGLSINLSGQVSQRWKWQGSINFTRGLESLISGEKIPLSHIPPTYGKVAVDYSNGPFSLKGVYRFNMNKPLASYGGSADNPDLATPIGALSWGTINFYSSYRVNPKVLISLAGENLMDKHYRPFASGVSAPGINLILSIRGSF